MGESITNTNRFFAEVIGTFALLFAGCGAIIANDLYGEALGHVGISMVFGLVVMVVIYAVGNISGAHLNPAVTLGFYAAKRLKGRFVGLYITAQAVGAFVAVGVLKLLFPEHDNLGATLPSIDIMRALVVEIILTFLLMFVILNVSTGHKEKGIMAGVAVGGTIALEALLAGPITGASMNPIRSLAPALLSGELQAIGIYILGPIIGALLAIPTCRWTQGKICCALRDE